MGLKGADKHVKRLRKLSGAEVAKLATAVIYEGADMIRAEAFRSISAGSVSGKNHKASPPGSPPNRDTGVLQANLEVEKTAPLVAKVISAAPYAAIQEFGGTINHPGGTPYFIGKDGLAVFVGKSGYGAYHHLPVTKPHTITLPARPYLRPARDKMRPVIQKRLAEQFGKLVQLSATIGGKP